ncbi:MAG: cyclic nucleotide-binding domain-containing protein [Verrucomicrobia bacterium]|nr:cyclic nucleotide-binding domain-containing protein [Verrucomicrobiota bacterium]
MSIALRNFEERDLESARLLMTGAVGPELGNSEYLQPEPVKANLLIDTAFGLVAEDEGKMEGTVTILMEQETPETVLGLLCRLCVPDTPARPALAVNLVGTALQSIIGNIQLCFAEIPSLDLWAQAACEQSGFIPCGFLPQKFGGQARFGGMVFAYLTEAARNARRPHPKIIPSVRDLASEVLRAHGLIEDAETREDVVAYPTECDFTVAPIEAEAVRTMLQSQTQQESEVFPFLQRTQTRLHLLLTVPTYLAAKDGEKVIGVIGYVHDPFDKRVQITEVVALDSEPQGCMIAGLFQRLTEELSPDYWEVLVSAHAPRMQKTFDQLGFVPCAYLPSFGTEHGLRADAIKMVKLNAGYESESVDLTSASKNIFTIIDTIFHEYSVGMAVLKLLRDLRIFRGMGEGELRRVARLFSQKLFRPGEVVFEEGTTGQELYVVERGEIEIRTKNGDKLLGAIRNGAVLGEIAFLNGEPRTARAISKSATIVRVIHRSDFDRLIQREMHLGLIFFQNVALDLAEKLKQSVVQAKAR